MFRNPLTDGIVVLIVLLLFFGPKRLPMLARSIGEGIREFKDGISSSSDEHDQLSSGESGAVGAGESGAVGAGESGAGERASAGSRADGR